ncbi:SDR family NAD(P)-dependent oxidoreductase [Pseudonocardia endophytica]|uniref:Gluconate 5-dehydrogenase n=1 Tax=Pseudonocardia endophytica TaxID=401976 RepID=A0A4R1HVK5_PSEEN|nr:SDR family NAD(P)-dependent oxidoreductase [Pseudonocardia endophytica]TCK26774.1 gluconate 5-dehydrogenase [Pseudonocardia endophytica]
MTTTLSGQVALVTGAAGGIGQSICRGLRDAGARVALVDVDKAALDAVADEWSGDDVATIAVDLTDDEETAALPARVRAELGGLDVLVNNAGVRQIVPMLELEPADWRRTLDVDLTAPFVLSRAAIPGMVEKGRGKIVNIASMAGHMAFRDRAAYCTAKAGLMMLTKTITMEFGASGIWCNAVAPGVVETPMTSAYFRSDEMAASIRANAPMERWAQPDEIARPVLFLAGPDSDYVNGTTLFADGGWTAGKGY